MSQSKTATDKVLVAIAAHADDVELNAGGTAAKWAAETGPVHIIMATNNCSGRPWEHLGIAPNPSDDWALAAKRIRHAEQQTAAEHIGATVHFMDFAQRYYSTPHGPVFINFDQPRTPSPSSLQGLTPLLVASQHTPSVERLAELLISLQPTLVLTQTPLDRDPEHHALASMVWRIFNDHAQAFEKATLRFWECGSSCENGMLQQPFDHFEDITDYYQTKLELCGYHKSQMIDSRWERVKHRAAKWGKHIGTKYAEPFCTAYFE